MVKCPLEVPQMLGVDREVRGELVTRKARHVDHVWGALSTFPLVSVI